MMGDPLDQRSELRQMLLFIDYPVEVYMTILTMSLRPSHWPAAVAGCLAVSTA